MARGTLEAVFGALGAGLQGYGAEKRQRDLDEEHRRQAADQQRMQLFQSGLEEEAPLQRRATALGQSGAMAGAAPSVPGMAASGLVGRALEQAGRDMGTDLTRGRRLTMGGVDYVQPFSRTQAGRDEREQSVQARQAQLEQATKAAEAETAFGRQKELIQLQGREARATAQTRTDTRVPPRPTGEQEKSYAFAERMGPANDVIARLGPKANLNRVSMALSTDNPVALAAVNRLLTADEQQLVSAIRSFAEPILRKNTGAAFGKNEIRWVEQQVVPISGDDEATQRFKAETRQRELETMRMLAIPAQRYYEWTMGPNAYEEETNATPSERPPLESFLR